ncbi:zinc ribbon domain-containing protein [Rummeliibacillus suwonensis]|uniref:zinc ribbon domain-containing protein n=1 Tax=Rummeliibacillus suwonensis TaxID=1306154 RepID=UPI001AAFE6C0|nr:zinc ribbon domain-containing protein [Rummeliibacillus suwonensis]MBO2535787.1 hypothetical protein [Rummeliibacillus suwonensis]
MMKNLSLCQSCGKPLNKKNKGTEKNGEYSNLYCKVCYINGEFTKKITLTEMQKTVLESLKYKPIPNKVKNLIVTNIQNLQRWSNEEGNKAYENKCNK